jgi:hypothetical protein
LREMFFTTSNSEIRIKDRCVISRLGIGYPGTVRQRTAGTRGAYGSERAWRQGRRNGPTY